MEDKTILTPPSLPTTKKKTNKKTSYVASLTESQKRGLLTGTLTLGGVIAGAGLYSLYSQESVPSYEPSPTPNPILETAEPCACTEPEPLVDMAGSVTDCMSFSEAFSEARGSVGSGGVFEWRNNIYNTYTESEWDCLCDNDKEAFGLAVVKSGYIKETNSDTFEDTAQAAKEAMAWDYDNDGIDEVTLEYRNGERVVKEVDLNNDGNIDVVHATHEEHIALRANDMIEDVEELHTESGIQKITGSDVGTAVTMEPVIGIRYNDNGLIDAIAIDEDGDGFADTLVVDYDQDGIQDLLMKNSDLDLEMDIMIVDEDKDGFENDEVVDANTLVDMDEFTIIEDEFILDEIEEIVMI